MDLLFLPAAGAVAPADVRCTVTALLCSPKLTTFSVYFPKAAELSPLRCRRRRHSVTNPPTTVSALAYSSTSVHPEAAPAEEEASSALAPFAAPRSRWLVVMEKLPDGVGSSRAEVIDYYVGTLARVLGSEKSAQMCIYDASWENEFGFCCEIDDAASRELACLPGVLSVRPDSDEESGKKYYSYPNHSSPQELKHEGSALEPSSSMGSNEYWIVQMDKPGVEVVTKAQMVDYYAHILTKVLRNEKDAQVCIYHISWEKDFGFCCHIDEECARDLADVPGVLSVRPDLNFGSQKKDYKGNNSDSKETTPAPVVRTKRLFVTGLSFYTSEKTLRAAFEGFGELVEVKIIMDKISKRSKGYAFIEYTTEEAAASALKEMNGKIINGWMIVVDVARTNPPRYSRERSRPTSSSVPLH